MLNDNEIPRTPSVKWYARVEVAGKPVTKKRLHFPDKKEKAYAAQIAWAYKLKYGANPSHDDSLAMFIEWHRGAKKDGTRPTAHMDGDNVRKTVQDALNGIVYADDSQIKYGATHQIPCVRYADKVVIWMGIIEEPKS